jgi:hypothetical protein
MGKVWTEMKTGLWVSPSFGRNCDRRGEALSGWLARIALVLCLGSTGVTACAEPSPRAASGSYDRFTQRLIQLQADQNGDGRTDQWSYMDGTSMIRGEADTDADGRIDRWEYFDDQSRLVRVGTSSANDGIEDTWTWTAEADGEGRVDRSQRRDRHLDRREYYRGGALVRSEEDTNGDGRVDRWDRYEGTVRRQVEFDTTLTTGRPNRRMLFDEQGRFLRVEADPELDGTFVTLRDALPEPVRPGQRR